MNIKITADSTCDLSPELLSENNISILPLTVDKNGTSYRDGVDITPEEIYAHVESGGDLCSTAAVNIYDYRSRFESFAKGYDAVVHITIGSGFSACYQNACAAAKDMPNVYVIDSRNLSSGHGLVVMETCRLAKNCRNTEDIDAMCAELCELTGRVEASFLMNRLEYMAKGGRCTNLAVLGANLFKIKPCIEVINGKMKVVKKYRGQYQKCLEMYVHDRLANRDDIVHDTLFITHTRVSAEELCSVRAAIERCDPFTHVYRTDAGCTVSCHCGPGTLGVLFIRKKAASSTEAAAMA